MFSEIRQLGEMSSSERGEYGLGRPQVSDEGKVSRVDVPSGIRLECNIQQPPSPLWATERISGLLA